MMQWIDDLGAPRLEWLGQNHDECMRRDPNYPRCYTDATTQAVLECAQPGAPADTDACVRQRINQIVAQNCLPACAAYLRGGEEYPWGRRAEATCEAQRDINVELIKQGYQPIAVDCVLGGRTCGAAQAVGFGVPAGCIGHENEWVTPTKGAPPVTTPPVAAAPKKSRAPLAGLLIGGVILGALAYAQGG